MSATATFSTDASSLSAVFAAWFAANPGVVSIDETLTLAGIGVRVQAGPSRPPVVSLPTGSFQLALDAYTIEVFAVDHGKTGERLLDFTLGATVTATAEITGQTLALGGVTASLRYDGEHSDLVDAVLDYVIKELVGKGKTWPLPKLDRLLGLQATLDSVGTHGGELAAVVGLTCQPKEPSPQLAVTVPEEDFHAQVTASATDELVQNVITCLFRPVKESAGVKVGKFGLEAKLEVSLEVFTPQIRFKDGKISGSASARGKASINGHGPDATVTLSLDVTPKTTDDGQKVSLVISIPKQHIHLPIHVPGFLDLIKGLIEDGISDLLNLVIKGLNKLLEKAPITLFELDNPYDVFGLDVALAFGTLGVKGDSLVTQVVATAKVPALA